MEANAQAGRIVPQVVISAPLPWLVPRSPAPNAVSAKLSQMAKKGERGLQGTGKVESRPVQLKEPLCTIHKNRRERRPFLGAQKPNHLDLKTPSRANGPLETMRDVMRASSADHACNLEFGI
jgi:hypothetical protein